MTDFADFATQVAWEQWPEQIEAQGDARRLFHGRGQCFAGFEYFTVDYFAPLLWIVLYREPELPFWSQFCDQLRQLLGAKIEAAVVQHRYQRTTPVDVLWGEVPGDMVAREQGLMFGLQLGGRQNIGYFMDMQPARQWLRRRAGNKRILNLFSYTCAFSVAAAAAGATAVVNIDMSKSALRLGRENHRRNVQSASNCEVQLLGHDIFRSLGKLRKLGPYDIAICDPPSRQAGSFEVRKDYPRLLRKLPEMLAPGGDALICLNAPYVDEAYLRSLVEEHWPEGVFVSRLHGRADFPERNSDAALKVLHYRAG